MPFVGAVDASLEDSLHKTMEEYIGDNDGHSAQEGCQNKKVTATRCWQRNVSMPRERPKNGAAQGLIVSRD